MSRRVDPRAERAAQNQQTLKSLVKLEPNKSCADCKRNKRELKFAVLVAALDLSLTLFTKTLAGPAGT